MLGKKILIGLCFLILTCACVHNVSNTFVNDQNVFYSDKKPRIKIKIDQNFKYSPGHHVAIKHKAELFLKSNTRETVFIRTYKGDFSPKDTFYEKNMYSSEQMTIVGHTFYVGTEIDKDEDDYYLRRIYITYPNQRTMFLVMCVTPLYNDNSWSNLNSITAKQKIIVREIVDQSDRRIEFLNY